MKIAYITTVSPYDKYSWSGTNYYIRKALEDQGCEVYCIYGYRKITLGMVFRKMKAKLLHKNYQAIRSVASAKGWSRYVAKHLERNTDAVLSFLLPIWKQTCRYSLILTVAMNICWDKDSTGL